MRSSFLQFRRAPFRILASVFTLALAVGAIGVMAVPAVTGQALREATARDGLPDIVMETSPITAAQVEAASRVAGVAEVEAEVAFGIELPDRYANGSTSGGATGRLVGLAFGPDHHMAPYGPRHADRRKGAGVAGRGDRRSVLRRTR